MKYENAIQILELNKCDNDIDIIKKQYRSLALLYHPDKNSDKGSTKKFQEIKEAYDYLISENIDLSDNELSDNEEEFSDIFENLNKNSYQYILYSFLKSILLKDKIIFDISAILQNISNTCEDNAIDLIKKIDKPILMKIYGILKNYSIVLHINDSFLTKMKNVILEKYSNDECIILNPTIEDLFENNLYRLKINGFLYIIPLWHHELIYDNSGNEIIVKCCPILPENIEIDRENNIIIYENFNIENILNKEIISINIRERIFVINREQLLLKKEQIVILYGMGISKINSNNIYDISNKSNIIVYLTINF
jgi:hypothetical protein